MSKVNAAKYVMDKSISYSESAVAKKPLILGCVDDSGIVRY